MSRRLAILILCGAVVAIAGCPAAAPTKVDETTTGTPKGSRTPGTGSSKAPGSKPSTAATLGPRSTPTPAGTATGTPTPGPTATGSGTPGPMPSATGSGTTATGTPEPAPKFATVLIEATGFKPSNVRIQKGGSVTFNNRDTGAEHSVEPDGSSKFTGTGNLEKRAEAATDGGSAGLAFSELGEYQFKCGVHPTETGLITVVAEQK